MTDHELSAKMAADVLTALALADEREVENRLVLVLDYERFDFVKLLMRNRLRSHPTPSKLLTAQSRTARASSRPRPRLRRRRSKRRCARRRS